MFAQSRFRWMPEDPLGIALYFVDSKQVHETPGHLRFLHSQMEDLHQLVEGLKTTVFHLLLDAKHECSVIDFARGLQTLGIEATAFLNIQTSAGMPRGTYRDHYLVKRTLAGLPLPNPFTQAWEVTQVCSMYQAAENILEDLFCDLVLELVPAQGWAQLATICSTHRDQDLQERVNRQRLTRGEPGDPRRSPVQSYPIYEAIA